ncbi:hypothetical protein E2C01_064982 [Portunus trituberculatus]|uniref:Uncharacterized protein n=1 Tax=Portunus trituberculatus TaxID=210409 RepID=A0A5B7HPW2_PORTR|nr:hypothetical protein [Portunus trituberculatus]
MRKKGNGEEEEEECWGDWQVFWCRGRVTYCCPEISNDGEQIPISRAAGKCSLAGRQSWAGDGPCRGRRRAVLSSGRLVFVTPDNRPL